MALGTVYETPGGHVPPAKHGYIIICDIVAFSEKPESEQVECIQYLDRQLHAFLAGLTLHASTYVNCTGDGFLAVVPTDAVDEPAEVCLRLCKTVIAACSSYRGSRDTDVESRALQVRFGLHKGDYRAEVEAFTGKHSIGRGPNHAARVAMVGDASHVVVSQPFYEVGQTNPWRNRFTKSFDIGVKHNRVATVRIFTGARDEQKLLSSATPRRLRLINEIDQRIRQDLEIIEETLADHLCTTKKSSRHENLGARISIFLRDPDGLLCPSYRYHWRDHHRAPGSGTRYRIDPPLGAVAYAYLKGATQLVRGLPDPKKDARAYYAAWLSQKKYRHTLEDLRSWGRHPRALIAIPFAAGNDNDARAVLCLDLSNPLEDTKQHALDDIVADLEEYLDIDLAWKLLARRLA